MILDFGLQILDLNRKLKITFARVLFIPKSAI